MVLVRGIFFVCVVTVWYFEWIVAEFMDVFAIFVTVYCCFRQTRVNVANFSRKEANEKRRTAPHTFTLQCHTE